MDNVGRLLLLLLIVVVFAPSWSGAGLSLSLSDDLVLFDEPVTVRVGGLDPGQQVTLVATTTDDSGLGWRSYAVFIGDAEGTIDTSRDAPVRGGYEGVDPSGLLWSMEPEGGEDGASTWFDLEPGSLQSVRVSAHTDDVEAASRVFHRTLLSPGVSVERVEFGEGDSRVIGDLYLPAGPGPFPGMLVLTGSGGGVHTTLAGALASRGYAAFAQAYFRADGLPDRLVRVPIDPLLLGVEYLRDHARVDGDRVGVAGVSRGAELALLLTTLDNGLKWAVAYAPSCATWGGVSRDPVPAWTLAGVGLPVTRTRGRFSFDSALNDPAIKDAMIPVERGKALLLLLSGDADAMWPSTRMGELVVARLEQHGQGERVRHVVYEGAGHFLPMVLTPAARTVGGPGRFAMGGTARANARAGRDAWAECLEFLESASAVEREEAVTR